MTNRILYRLDLDYYEPETGLIVGDLGFSICDSYETLTADFESLKNGAIEALKDELNEFADIPVLSIIQAEFDDDDAENVETQKTITVLINRNDSGILEAIAERFKGAEIILAR